MRAPEGCARPGNALGDRGTCRGGQCRCVIPSRLRLSCAQRTPARSGPAPGLIGWPAAAAPADLHVFIAPRRSGSGPVGRTGPPPAPAQPGEMGGCVDNLRSLLDTAFGWGRPNVGVPRTTTEGGWVIATHPFTKRRLGLIPDGSRHGLPADPGRCGHAGAPLDSVLADLIVLREVRGMLPVGPKAPHGEWGSSERIPQSGVVPGAFRALPRARPDSAPDPGSPRRPHQESWSSPRQVFGLGRARERMAADAHPPGVPHSGWSGGAPVRSSPGMRAPEGARSGG